MLEDEFLRGVLLGLILGLFLSGGLFLPGELMGSFLIGGFLWLVSVFFPRRSFAEEMTSPLSLLLFRLTTVSMFSICWVLGILLGVVLQGVDLLGAGDEKNNTAAAIDWVGSWVLFRGARV